MPPFSTSDHDSIEFSILLNDNSFRVNGQQSVIRDFRKADYLSIESFLMSISWPDFFESCANIEDFYSKFLTVVNFAIDTFVPLKKLSYLSTRYPHKILTEQRKKKVLWRKLKKSRSVCMAEKYKNQAKLVKSRIKRFYADNERKLINKQNLKSFFDFVNTRLKNKKDVSNLYVNDCLISQDADKARAFNNFFVCFYYG